MKKNQLFVNIYNKLVSYNWTRNIIKTQKINKKFNVIYKPIIRVFNLYANAYSLPEFNQWICFFPATSQVMGGDVDCYLGPSTYPQGESSWDYVGLYPCCVLVHSSNTTVPSSVSTDCMVTGQLTLCGVESTIARGTIFCIKGQTVVISLYIQVPMKYFLNVYTNSIRKSRILEMIWINPWTSHINR